MSQSTTRPRCELDADRRCAGPGDTHVVYRGGVIGPLCVFHAYRFTCRKRDYAEVRTSWRPHTLLDHPGQDWLSDIVVEHLEGHYGRPLVEVEYAVVYRVLSEDGAVYSGAVTPYCQGNAVTAALLGELAPDTAARIEGGAGDE